MAIEVKKYRPSFEWFYGENGVIHIGDGNQTACKKDIKEFKKFYNLVKQYSLIKDAAFCKKCREAYHRRDEREFPTVP
jgi:hypothetical protein